MRSAIVGGGIGMGSRVSGDIVVAWDMEWRFDVLMGLRCDRDELNIALPSVCSLSIIPTNSPASSYECRFDIASPRVTTRKLDSERRRREERDASGDILCFRIVSRALVCLS